MKILNVVLLFAFVSSCAQSPSETKLRLIKNTEIKQYETMLEYSQDYESLSYLREIKLSEDNKGVLTYTSIDPPCSFYNTNQKQFINSEKFNEWLNEYTNKSGRKPYNIETHLYNDTLCVVSGDELFILNFKNFELLQKSEVPINDGLYFYKSKEYTNRTNKQLSIHSLTGTLVRQIEYPRQTLSDYMFFANDNMYVYNDYTNEVGYCSLDSLDSFAVKRRKLQLQDDLHLMYVSDKYFVCGYKNVNSVPVKSNELVFISLADPNEKMSVRLDPSVINDSIMDKTIVKGNVDGAPEPEFQPYWRICGVGDTYYILVQSQHKLYLYSFKVK
jgi:hypothetical protein